MSEHPAPPARRVPATVAWIYGFAFASAVSALVYQVVWTRLLALPFGRTTLAASAVVAGFMGGMGLGAWLFQRVLRDRADEALRVYAGLECAIAASTALLTVVLETLPRVFAAASPFVPDGLPLTLLRVGTVIALLLVPAGFMGATYPALCAVLIHSREGVTRHLGRIYGLNTLGAAAGALVAGFVLIEALGLRASVAVAAVLNAAIGAAAFGLARRLGPGERSRAALPDDEARLPSALPHGVTAAVLFGSGLATLAYEILWFRALQYVFGNSTYALTLMLAVFLLGLGVGGLLFGRLAGRARPERDLAACQLVVAVTALAAIAGIAAVLGDERLGGAVSVFAPAFYERPWWQRLLVDAALGGALLLPATLGMGLSFPLATRLYLADVRRLGRRVGGSVLLANTGSIAGSVLAAIAILPLLGTVGGTLLVAGANLGLGLLVLACAEGRRRGRVAMAGLAVAVCAALALALPDRLPFRGEGRTAFADSVLRFEEEGDLATVQVWEDPAIPGALAMTIDGVAIAVSPAWFPTVYAKQRLLAHLPLAVDGGVRRALAVGLGSGSTVHALAGYPGVRDIDAVEISEGVVHAAARFPESGVLDDPRVDLVVEDVFHFLLRGDTRYDLVVADAKQNPDFSSNWTVLSREFYAAARDRLTDRGLLVQWIPLSTLARDFRVTLRTFAGVFPEMGVFVHAPHQVLLVGSDAPLAGRPRIPTRAFEGLPGFADLRRLGLRNRAALGAMWVGARDDVLRAVGEGPTSTWNHTPVEFSAYKTSAAERRDAPRENLALLVGMAEAAGPSPFLPPEAPIATSTALLRRAHLAVLAERRGEALDLARRALAANPRDVLARRLVEQLGR